MSQLQQASSNTNSHYPFENIEGNLFGPLCLKTHWDPTMVLKHVLPQQKVGLPQDFRPWVKVCKNYVTSGPTMQDPLVPKDMVFPSGGNVYPNVRYRNGVDKESVLRTLDHPLDKWCPSTQYIPRQDSNMYVSGSTVPERKAISNAFVSELSMPQALLRTDVYTCRSENDTKYFERSGRMFNNPTKQDRYGADKYYALPNANHGRGEPMPHGGVNEVRPTRQAMISKGPFPQPGGALPAQAMGSRPISSYNINHPDKNNTSFVGVTTSGLAAPVW